MSGAQAKKAIGFHGMFREVKKKADSMLADRGFVVIPLDPKEPTMALWKKEAFPGYDFVVMFSVSRMDARNGMMGLSVHLGVRSRWQFEFESNAGISLGRPVGEAEPFRRVLGVPLQWLTAIWPPALPSFTDSMLRWMEVPMAKALNTLDDVFYYFDHQGVAFLEMVGTEEGLISTLLNLEDFPGRRGGGGPGAPRPLLSAAALLCRRRQFDEALAAVSRAEAKAENDLRSENINQASYEETRAMCGLIRSSIVDHSLGQ